MNTISKYLILILSIFTLTNCVEDEVFVGPPSISDVTLNPTAPGATDDVIVSAKITDLKGVESATLYYKLSTDGAYTSVPMNALSSAQHTFAASIPAHPMGTTIVYYILAKNVSDLQATHPVNAPVTTAAYSIGAPAIVLNEIFSRGTTTDPDWIEIYNNSNASVNISGFKVYDSGGQGGTKPKMEIPAGTTIAAHGFYVIVVDDAASANPTGSNFGLSSSGEEVWLESAAGFVIDNAMIPAMPVATTSYGRMPDGSTNWGIMNNITKGTSNTN